MILWFFLFVGTDVNAKTSDECLADYNKEITEINKSCDKDSKCIFDYSKQAADNMKQCQDEASADGNGGSSTAAEKYGLKKTAEDAKLPNIGANLPDMVGKVLAALLGLTATIFFVLMIYAGVTWMTAQGSTEKVTTAKKIIVNCVLGLVVIAMAYAITNFVFKSLG